MKLTNKAIQIDETIYVSLPLGWIKANDIKKGDNIELEILDFKKILITPSKK